MALYPKELEGLTIWHNGNFLPIAEANINIMSHGLHYATAVFEGIRIYNGKPFLLHEHIVRLRSSAKALHMEYEFTDEELMAACEQITSRNNIQYGYIRPLVWRGSEALLVAGKGTVVHVAIAAWGSFEDTRKTLRQTGVQLCYVEHKKFPGPLAATKCSAVYALCHVVKLEAMEKNCFDALCLDMHGNVTEASTSNLFMIKNGVLYTPIADCFLNGLTRQTIIKLAKQLGFEVQECHLKPSDVETADAVFLSGTALEILPVNSIITTNDKVTTYDIEHPIFVALENAYFSLINAVN